MKPRTAWDFLGWGFLLWLIGYALGIALFMLVPYQFIGLIITPFGIAIALWILLTKIRSQSFRYYLLLGIVWTFIAITCDYFFLYKLFQPSDGYYKFDVYFYYVTTLVLPILVGWWKKTRTGSVEAQQQSQNQ